VSEVNLLVDRSKCDGTRAVQRRRHKMRAGSRKASLHSLEGGHRSS